MENRGNRCYYVNLSKDKKQNISFIPFIPHKLEYTPFF